MDYWVKILLCFFVAIVVGGQAASLHDHNSLPSYHEDVPEAVISDLHEVLKIFLPQPHPTQASSPLLSQSAAPSASTSASSYPSPSVLPPCYRKSGTKFDFSQYWVPKEGQWDETADRERIFLGDNGKPISILDAVGQVIANVSSGTLDKCASEHTCLLSNGALVHLSKKKKDKIPIFEIIGKPGRQRNLFGFGSGRQNLVPYVSVAVNGLPEGTTLYIPDMDGIILPSGQQHNGCVRVDDRRSSSSPQDACHIDMFVATYVDYLMLNVRDSVSARVQPCTVQNYVTRDHLAYMHADTSDAVIMMALNDTREEEL